MFMANDSDKIFDLEKEIASLPQGYISKKNINGSIKKYYQWTENGKKKSKYVDEGRASELEPLIEKRRMLQDELKALKRTSPNGRGNYGKRIERVFKTSVLLGKVLKNYVDQVKALRRRDCYDYLEKYIKEDPLGKVFILYGLRRTGKTTLIKQAILSLSLHDFEKAAFIQLKPGDSLSEVNNDLNRLLDTGYKYVFIDEVTLAEDFIEGAALLSDIYAASGMKIVLSGTDSLGFIFSKSTELYDRCTLLHTTFIPYREFERVLGIEGIDEYIRYGGTMSLGGAHYNEAVTFKTKESTDEYIDSAIAKNIQHSLRYYQDGGHFRHLAELYEKDELTSAINRVVEDINHQFTIEVLTRDFISHDLGISRRNLRKDRHTPTDILDRIDKDSFTKGLKSALSILNKEEQSVTITDAHRIEIKEYLDLLDLTVDIPTEFIPVKNEKLYRTAVAQPGMRYAQAEALVKQLLIDRAFQSISASDRKLVLERILTEIKGRMMEDIVLLEVMKANPRKDVFRLQFAVGEFDMVIADTENATCKIYEIKHSEVLLPEQAKHLKDSKKCESAEFRFGHITDKAVIYRGKTREEGGILYINVEEFLKSLGRDE